MALVFDQSMRGFLHVDEDDPWVRLTIDNKRMVVEAVANANVVNLGLTELGLVEKEGECVEPVMPPEIKEAHRLAYALEGMIPRSQSERLCGVKGGLRRHIVALEWDEYWTRVDCEDRSKRVRICTEMQQNGASWEAAVDAAIAAVPEIREAG